MVIFGDWGYGPEDDRYGIEAQGRLHDPALIRSQGNPSLSTYGNTDEPLLWGDDDVILLGEGEDDE